MKQLVVMLSSRPVLIVNILWPAPSVRVSVAGGTGPLFLAGTAATGQVPLSWWLPGLVQFDHFVSFFFLLCDLFNSVMIRHVSTSGNWLSAIKHASFSLLTLF
jgi:hypothetical protein